MADAAGAGIQQQPSTCAKCNKEIGDEKVLCERCDVQYCSRSCQVLHWKLHKKRCTHSYNDAPADTSSEDDEAHINSEDDGAHTNAPTGTGLRRLVSKPFTRLNNGTWLHGRPEMDVYKLLIDTYRMRMEDNANFDGIREHDSIYASDTNDGGAGFHRFLTLAEEKIDLFPPWWGIIKKMECEGLGTSPGWSSLRTKVTKDDIAEHYGQVTFPTQLRIFGEFIYGFMPGGEDTSATRYFMMTHES